MLLVTAGALQDRMGYRGSGRGTKVVVFVAWLLWPWGPRRPGYNGSVLRSCLDLLRGFGKECGAAGLLWAGAELWQHRRWLRPPMVMASSGSRPPPGWCPLVGDYFRTVDLLSLLVCLPLHHALAPLHVSIMRWMEAISRFKPTCIAVCQHRAQLQTWVPSEQFCTYEVLASHTREGLSVTKGGRDDGARGPRLAPSAGSRRRKRNCGSPAADTRLLLEPQVVAPVGADGAEATNLGAGGSADQSTVHLGDELLCSGGRLQPAC